MSNNTIRVIDGVLDRVNTHPEYDACLSQHFVNELIQEANNHSVSMEIENGRSLNKRVLAYQREKNLEHLRTASDYLSRNSLSLPVLAKLGSLVEPENHPYPNFRAESVRYGDYYGTTPEMVPQELDNLLYDLDRVESHPIMRAANAHLELVRIHPYLDGNGRVARLVQNFCLQQRGYPPAVILEDEVELYKAHLDSVFYERLNKDPGRDQRETCKFQSFIETKVLESARKLEKELQKNRIYDVSLEKLDSKEVLHSVARALRGYGSKVGGPISAHSLKFKKKKGSMEVKGDIGSDDLRSFLIEKANKYGFVPIVQTRK